MDNLTLYQLTDEYLALMDLAAEEEADEASFDAALTALQGEIFEKGIAVAQVIKNLEAFSEAAKGEGKRMLLRAEMAEKRADRIREYLKNQMERSGIKKMDSPYFSVAVRKNRARVEIEGGADIPPDLCVIIPQQLRPNKVAIAKELESGADIPGCRLVTSTRLDIK